MAIEIVGGCMSRTRVLVVEDDEEFQEFYKQFFRTHEDEFSWVLAKTGDAAAVEGIQAGLVNVVVPPKISIRNSSKLGPFAIPAGQSQTFTVDLTIDPNATEADNPLDIVLHFDSGNQIVEPGAPDTTLDTQVSFTSSDPLFLVESPETCVRHDLA